MNVVITMAGLGTRFRSAGYTIPKYEIIVKGKSLFEWSISSLEDFFCDQWYFITLKQNNSRDYISKMLSKWNLKYQIIELDNMTDGQASTALLVKNNLNPNDAISIFNIDTHIKPNNILRHDLRGDGFVHLFESTGDKWSFAKINSEYEIIDIKEKIAISNLATVGFYYFSSFSVFEELYNLTYPQNEKSSLEKYIAPMYYTGINKLSLKVYSKIIGKENIVPLGTPEDIILFEKLRS
jgi:dTDP-glucose pyrophosphorylase